MLANHQIEVYIDAQSYKLPACAMPTAICLCTHPAVDQCGICYILHLSAMPTAMPIYQTLTHLFLAKESLPALCFALLARLVWTTSALVHAVDAHTPAI